MEAVTSSQNTRALKKLLDSVNSHIHSLQSLGVEPDSYSSLLCSILVNKLPSDLQLLISRKVSEVLVLAVMEELVPLAPMCHHAAKRISMRTQLLSQMNQWHSGVSQSSNTMNSSCPD